MRNSILVIVFVALAFAATLYGNTLTYQSTPYWATVVFEYVLFGLAFWFLLQEGKKNRETIVRTKAAAQDMELAKSAGFGMWMKYLSITFGTMIVFVTVEAIIPNTPEFDIFSGMILVGWVLIFLFLAAYLALGEMVFFRRYIYGPIISMSPDWEVKWAYQSRMLKTMLMTLWSPFALTALGFAYSIMAYGRASETGYLNTFFLGLGVSFFVVGLLWLLIEGSRFVEKHH